jgi:hypothetical protein
MGIFFLNLFHGRTQKLFLICRTILMENINEEVIKKIQRKIRKRSNKKLRENILNEIYTVSL